MKALKIKPGAELEIEIFDQDAIDMNGKLFLKKIIKFIEYDYEDEDEKKEYGFTGTKLTGSIPLGQVWECQICTLLNESNQDECAACGNKR